MKLELKSLSFKPTPQLKRAIAAEAKREQRKEGDLIRRILLRHYGLLNGNHPAR